MRKRFIGILLAAILLTVLFTSCSSSVRDEIIVISREDGSGTRGAFTEITGIAADGSDNTTEEAIVVNSTSVVMINVASNVQGIGYISLGSLNDTVTAISVDGAAATLRTLKIIHILYPETLLLPHKVRLMMQLRISLIIF